MVGIIFKGGHGSLTCRGRLLLNLCKSQQSNSINVKTFSRLLHLIIESLSISFSLQPRLNLVVVLYEHTHAAITKLHVPRRSAKLC